jgi:hypothetical protein
LENWYDLLAFVPRYELGDIASAIGDRQFASILQLFLHDERREITLGRMEIIPPRPYAPNDRPLAKLHDGFLVDLPDWPMPENVKNFEQISLTFVFFNCKIRARLFGITLINSSKSLKLDEYWIISRDWIIFLNIILQQTIFFLQISDIKMSTCTS